MTIIRLGFDKKRSVSNLPFGSHLRSFSLSTSVQRIQSPEDLTLGGVERVIDEGGLVQMSETKHLTNLPD